MKRFIVYAVLFAAACGLSFFIADVAVDTVSAPTAIESASECPVVQGCATGQCHGLDDVPEPDGIHEMKCPEDGCASTECHAWDALSDGYRRASGMSLMVWILIPSIFACIAILMVRKSR